MDYKTGNTSEVDVHHLQSQVSTGMSFTFVDGVDLLPIDGPENHPHLIDIETFMPSDSEDIPPNHTLKVWDTVVTMLYTVAPHNLSDFLDLERNDFRILMVCNDVDERLVVWRRGTEVLVSRYSTQPGM